MQTINIANKAYARLGELSYSELKVAKDLRKALLYGAGQVEGVSMKLADIQASVGEGYTVLEALHMLEAQKHGRLLREQTVSVTVYEDGDEWVADGLLIESGGYLTAFLLGSDRVVDVLSPSEMDGSGYGPSDIADAVEDVVVYLEPDGTTTDSELTDAKGREWCKFDHEWS